MKQNNLYNKIENLTLKPLVFKTIYGFVYYDYDDILMFKADGHTTWVYTINDSHSKTFNLLKILHSLSYIEKKYPNNILYRCHRSAIINLKYIEKLEIKTRKLFLQNGINVDISGEFLKYLKFISIA